MEMRHIIVVAVVFALMALFLGNAGAAGMVVRGQEPCDCPSLIARGIIPDPLNRLADLLYVPQVASALDSVAVEVRSMLTQPSEEATVEPEEAAKEPKEKSTLEEKPEKPAKETIRRPAKKKTVAQSKKPSHKKKKRVKVPSRAM
jgi:outer membrane biosynthesis protein TonB